MLSVNGFTGHVSHVLPGGLMNRCRHTICTIVPQYDCNIYSLKMYMRSRSSGRRIRGIDRGSVEGSSSQETFDRQMMRMALQLASTPGPGITDPNPMVGCVIVGDDGTTVVGQGYHPKAGMPHAEVYALRAAGQRAKGGTAYVTLEPCDHYGRTPPCSQALIDAGIRRVVIGVGDPNPLVAGGGIARLQRAGVEVLVGCEEESCFTINKDFMDRMMCK